MEKPMNLSAHYSEDISQTALALLALVAAGRTLNSATVRSLHSLLNSQNDSTENRVNLAIFSDCDDEYGNVETPVIIPFAERNASTNRCHNGYGTLSLKNRTTNHSEYGSWPRIFSPDAADCEDDENIFCLAATAPALKIYAE